jgi:hypothetical protein
LNINGAVMGSAANTQSLTLNATSAGVVNVTSTLGYNPLGNNASLRNLTLTHSKGATFAAAVKAETSVVLSNTTAGRTITFQDNLTTQTLTTTGSDYNLALLGSNTNITGTQAATVFNNTGTLTLGNNATDTLTFAGGLTATAPISISAAGQISTTNADITFGSAPVTLLDNATFNSGDGNILFGGTIDTSAASATASSLTLNSNATTTLGGAVGTTRALSSLATDAGAPGSLGSVVINGGSVTTTGSQIYGEAVKLGLNTTFTSTAAAGAGGGVGASAGNITFDSTIDTSDASVVARSLNINSNATTTFGGAVGATRALSSLITDTTLAGPIFLRGGSITTTGAQSFGGAMRLNNDTIIQAGAGHVTFHGSIDTDANALADASLDVNSSGITTFNAAVGSNRTLSTLTTDAAGTVRMNAATVNTRGTQTYLDAMRIAQNTTLHSQTGTLNAVRIADAGQNFDVTLHSATALLLKDLDIGGKLQVTTKSGGVSQLPNTSLQVGGTSTFTADTGTDQDAALSNTGNRLLGMLTLDTLAGGSWRDVSVATTTALTLAPLQSSGAVNLQTLGAALTTDTIAASGNLTIDTRNSQGVGGATSLGAAVVSGNMAIQTGGGSVAQTGQMVVTGNTAIAAGTGVITLDNVLNNFGGALSLQGQSTSVATSGDLQLASVVNAGPMTLRAPNGSIDLGNAFITGGNLVLESKTDLNLGGANISGNLSMSSTEGSVTFGSATVQGNLSATTQGQQIDLGSATVGQNLVVQSNGGNIVQSTANGVRLSVSGTSNLDAGTGNITLPNVPNQFAGVVTVKANDATLAATNGLTLGATVLTGNLKATVANGSINQTAPLNVAGTSQFSAAQGDVLLSQANTLTQTVSINAVNAVLNTNTALSFGASALTGNLTVKVADGDITQRGPVQVTGVSTLVADNGNITLTEAANRFDDRVNITTPKALQLTSGGALSMGEVSVLETTDLQSNGKLDLGTSADYKGKLTAKSGGFEIMQSGPLKAGAAVDFDAGSAKIDLFNPQNLWLGALYFKGGIIMINHPQLLNATNSGSLMVRVETTMPVASTQRVNSPQQANPVRTQASQSQTGGGTATQAQPAASTAAKPAGADVTVSVARPATTSQSGLVTVAVSPEVATAGKGFAFSLAEHLPADVPKEAPARVSQVDGKPLPDWLKFEAGTQKFIANEVPPGAFPIQIKVSVGGTDTVIVVTEQPK